MDVMLSALLLVLDPYVLAVMAATAVYGLLVGSIPGLTASMAAALLVPVTFFMEPVPALAGIVTMAAMAIFAGDLPGAFLRIPGTPASAAYADEAHRMTLSGRAELALGVGLVCSAIGGVFGAIVLLFGAPALAQVALQFSTVEYFWLACLGLTATVAVSHGYWAKGVVSLMIGLVVATVGLDPVSGQMRFTFGLTALSGGLGFIPVLIGLFAISEILRYAIGAKRTTVPADMQIGNIFRGIFRELGRLKLSIARGCGIGTIIGAIPGAGADIAAYISYAVARRFSERKDAFGTGVVDGLAPATAANNSSIGGAFVPATVFGIPGDSLTAIVIGVLYMKGLNPGPTVFLMKAELINAVFISYLVANLLLLPFGFMAIRLFKQVLRVPQTILMPLILGFCIVGAFAVENATFAVTAMLIMGIIGFFMEENGFPLAPVILGLVLGPMVEEMFLTSLIKGDGNFLYFFSRPLAAVLGTITILIWLVPLGLALRRRLKAMPA